MTTTDADKPLNTGRYETYSAYDRWLVSQDVPVHTGYYVEDAREIERGWWSLRGCPAAMLNLVGHQGVTEAHLLEVPPGETLPPFRMALEEVIYVLEGRGMATVWAGSRPAHCAKKLKPERPPPMVKGKPVTGAITDSCGRVSSKVHVPWQPGSEIGVTSCPTAKT